MNGNCFAPLSKLSTMMRFTSSAHCSFAPCPAPGSVTSRDWGVLLGGEEKEFKRKRKEVGVCQTNGSLLPPTCSLKASQSLGKQTCITPPRRVIPSQQTPNPPVRIEHLPNLVTQARRRYQFITARSALTALALTALTLPHCPHCAALRLTALFGLTRSALAAVLSP